MINVDTVIAALNTEIDTVQDQIDKTLYSHGRSVKEGYEDANRALRAELKELKRRLFEMADEV